MARQQQASTAALDIPVGGGRLDVGGADRLVRALLSTPFLAAALLLTTWPIVSLMPTAGTDPSWQAGLYMGLEGGLQFGRELVFTYGPLGFLHVPLLFGNGLWMLTFAYQLLARAALAVSLLWVARRALPLPLALAACFVVLVLGELPGALVLVAFIWCFLAVAEEPPAFARPLVVYAGGAVAAVELLGKVNFGVSVLVLCLIALLAVPGRRANLARFAAVFAAVFLGLWLLTGQPLANLPDYASNSLQFISAYSREMGVDLGSLPWEIPAALAASAIACVGVVYAARKEGWGSRLGSLLLLAAFAYLSFKQDFIRRGPQGTLDFALLLTGAALAIAARLPQGPGPRRVPRLVLSSALIAPMLALVVWALPAPSFWAALKPDDHVSWLREDIHAFASSSTRAQIQAEGAKAMRASYDLPPSIRRRIGDRTVTIDPWEIGVAWAYGLNWHPLPVIQDYSAYTTALDRLNARALAGAGPRTILRQSPGQEDLAPAGVDGRYPGWDSPAAKLALLCNYRAALTTPRWQLVEKTAPRCSPPSPLGSVEASSGQAIPVPTEPGRDQIVFAKIHGLGLTAPESALSLLYRAPTRSVSFDPGGTWNLAADTAADGLILRAPRAVDFPRPFQLAPDPRRFSVAVNGAPSRPIEVEFFSQRVRP